MLPTLHSEVDHRSAEAPRTDSSRLLIPNQSTTLPIKNNLENTAASANVTAEIGGSGVSQKLDFMAVFEGNNSLHEDDADDVACFNSIRDMLSSG